MNIKIMVLRNVTPFLPFSISQSDLFYLLIVGARVIVTHHSRQDSSGRVTSPSQRPQPDNTQHSQQTDIHAAARDASYFGRYLPTFRKNLLHPSTAVRRRQQVAQDVGLYPSICRTPYFREFDHKTRVADPSVQHRSERDVEPAVAMISGVVTRSATGAVNGLTL